MSKALKTVKNEIVSYFANFFIFDLGRMDGPAVNISFNQEHAFKISVEINQYFCLIKFALSEQFKAKLN